MQDSLFFLKIGAYLF